MAKTIVEKIFSEQCGRNISAGDVVMAPVSGAMLHDITGPLAIDKFYEMGGDRVFDPAKVIMMFDHQAPADSLDAAENQKKMRIFAKEQGIYNYDIKEGVCHQVTMEKGRVSPGDIVVGGDSHTCTYGAAGAFATGIGSTDLGFVLRFGCLYFRVPETIRAEVSGRFSDLVGPKDLILKMTGDIGADGATYRAIEFCGETIERMGMAGRMTCCNMAIEMGAKAGLVPPDAVTRRWCEEYTSCTWKEFVSDPGATYHSTRSFDVSDLVPQVAVPHNVDHVVDVTAVAGTPVDQVFIGSCTNGRYEDLAEAAQVLKYRSFSNDVRVLVIPASRTEYLKALRAGIIERFVEAGALVEAPCCGPCMGGSFGLIAAGEVSFATSNRNFRGRQGSTSGEVYLGSPATATATAITGKITDPREVA
ncbi:MAG: 3-isopropylmalate dehydratase large subunit [Methanospirillaceae archaeon]|nr:3-isopropylmalate dehydratase large subunit [Methanospirillaceae archaeon]